MTHVIRLVENATCSPPPLLYIPPSLYLQTYVQSFLISMVTPHRLHIARSTLQIPLEGLRNIKYLDDVFHAEGFLLVDCESLSGTYCIFDLLHAR